MVGVKTRRNEQHQLRASSNPAASEEGGAADQDLDLLMVQEKGLVTSRSRWQLVASARREHRVPQNVDRLLENAARAAGIVAHTNGAISLQARARTRGDPGRALQSAESADCSCSGRAGSKVEEEQQQQPAAAAVQHAA